VRIEEVVGKDAAIVQWDIVRGLVRVNDAGAKEIGKLLGDRDSASVGPVDALVAACQLGEDAVLVFANAQRFWNDPQVAQAIWNLRDAFKASGRTLALLTTGTTLPALLQFLKFASTGVFWPPSFTLGLVASVQVHAHSGMIPSLPRFAPRNRDWPVSYRK
jgi:hypothetical protein